ncbi:hypothetical protein [Kitasatospora sp. NPDC086791]|uniref:hypothetical protein n=1 Tax=Kitasatospora sp. NPDC086791 TaxID=3155178 RepID=UPI00342F3F63
MVEIPEEAQAAALRAVATRAREREQAEYWMLERVRESVIEAVQAGAMRSRVSKLAGISPNTLTAWMRDAGIEVRAKAPAKKAGAK